MQLTWRVNQLWLSTGLQENQSGGAFFKELTESQAQNTNADLQRPMLTFPVDASPLSWTVSGDELLTAAVAVKPAVWQSQQRREAADWNTETKEGFRCKGWFIHKKKETMVPEFTFKCDFVLSLGSEYVSEPLIDKRLIKVKVLLEQSF